MAARGKVAAQYQGEERDGDGEDGLHEGRKYLNTAVGRRARGSSRSARSGPSSHGCTARAGIA
jgi:hypothetical protein